jgi:hypothetical protein
MLTTILLGSACAMALCGCGEATGTVGGGAMTNPLVGSWISQGNDVAVLLAAKPLNYTKITATFNDDGSYTVDGIDTSNKDTTFTGTYTATPSSVNGIINITVTQVQPANTLAQGIYSIDTSVSPARMTYEVVQTQPTNGLTPPTADKGFGSTVFNGAMISTLIQKFNRQ